jgi:hypothetical protein
MPARREPVMPERYLAAITVLCERLPLEDVNWALTGSVAHRLQGVDVPVRDIDVQTDAPGAFLVGEALADYVVEPPGDRETERMQSIFGVFCILGLDVEVMGGVRKRSGPGQAWGPPTDPADHRVAVRLDDLTVPVLSLLYEASAYETLGRHERAALLRAAAQSPYRHERAP